MKLYRLPFVLRSPSEDTEDKYLAEIPALPGCRAWGNTAAEALENLQSVATAFIASYQEHGDPLPNEVLGTALDIDASQVVSEVVVAA
ncbi:MAG: type II toxin-antitoxin system HicB family antitoxin [Chloroflexi bacterium]|nr:type II toxin-antitoxin system HicB family antitoxin [Chloroflexota bacterium]